MAGAFRDDLEAARSRAEALHEENEELREEVARLRAQAPAEAQPQVDRGPDSLTKRTLARLEELVEEHEDAPALAELTVAVRDEEPSPPRPAPVDDHASLALPKQVSQLHVLEWQLAEAMKEREELRAGLQRRIRSFWVGVGLGIAVGVLLASLLR